MTKQLDRNCTPMLTAGRQSDDGCSFVISDINTEEADSEIRKICFGSKLTMPTTSRISVLNEDEIEPLDNVALVQNVGVSHPKDQFRSSSQQWNRWVHLPTRKKKAAVLQYFCLARSFRIITIDSDNVSARCCAFRKDKDISEMQITDRDGCPIFDAWLQNSNWPNSGSRWILETCGNLVLTIQRSESIISLEKSGDDAKFKPEKIDCRRWSVVDWNGDVFGFLVASGGGEAIFVENPNKETVAQFVRQCDLSGRLRNESDGDFARNASSVKLTQKGKRNSEKSIWTCIQQEDGELLLRLDDASAYFDTQGITLAAKLLILSGIIKIIDLHCDASKKSCSLFSSESTL